MALTRRRVLQPILPTIADLDLSRSSFDYDRQSDTLYWDFAGEPRTAVSVPVSNHLLYSVDAATEAVVGFQIDGFLAAAVFEFPLFLEIADRIGLHPEEVAAIRAGLDPAVPRGSILQFLFASLAAVAPSAPARSRTSRSA